ncbi:MAG: zinc/iron permease [Parcubacteria group bacterium Gr01-1014_49]|nr:MAG: zinc/iron permease [Parcubacteria group bacterium Gr01-1014_49]
MISRMTVFYVALAAFAATLIGGSFALRFRDKLHLVLGFSAGAVAGVALFDLLPEAIELGTKYHDPSTIALFVAFGLFGYLILDRMVLLHTHEEDEPHGASEENASRGFLGAFILAAHSFLDGVAIGVGFQASAALGVVVAAAVLTHDFSDGINTVNLVLKNGGSRERAFRWLLVGAAAPVCGVISTLFFHIPESYIGLVLAVFAGSFLYLSASDLIPESHHRHPRALTTAMTLLGAALLYLVVRLV